MEIVYIAQLHLMLTLPQPSLLDLCPGIGGFAVTSVLQCVCGLSGLSHWTSMLYHIYFSRPPYPFRFQTSLQLHCLLELLALASPGLTHSAGSQGPVRLNS